jgi:uncharacterized protein
MSEGLARPEPRVTPVNEPYFVGAHKGKLMLQQCSSCCKFLFYPRVACPYCFALGTLLWVEASGQGSVESFSFVHRPQHPSFLSEVPIAFAAIRLVEGPTMLSVVRDVNARSIRLGMAVRADFEPINADYSLVIWKPATAHTGAATSSDV